jgi:epoxyqueuosine reductase
MVGGRARLRPHYEKDIVGPVERFDERKTAYSRADRREYAGPDEAIEVGLATKAAKRMRGFLREDFALNSAGRAIDTLVRKYAYSREDFPRRWAFKGEPLQVDNPVRMADEVKAVARWFGADLVGVCELDMRWVYSVWGDHNAKLGPDVQVGDPVVIPEGCRYAIAFAVEMDYEDVMRSPAVIPSTDLGYSKMAFTATSLAEYIRLLGYKAVPSGNDMALTIPICVDAGLGELSRSGMLITAEYGPRVRIAKVFTNLPLEPDEPVDLGVQAFCEVCKKCADHCPGKAITHGDKTADARMECNNSGVRKWQIDAQKCLAFWVKNGTAGCANCIRTCPWNKPPGWTHRLVRSGIKAAPSLDPLFVRVDDLLGYGRPKMNPTPGRRYRGSKR